VADSHEHGNKSLGFTNVPDLLNDYPAKTSYYVSKLTVIQSLEPDRNKCTDHSYYYCNIYVSFFSRLVVLSPPNSRFNTRPVHVGSVSDNVALAEVSRRFLRSCDRTS
jgi:hypothetical protein